MIKTVVDWGLIIKKLAENNKTSKAEVCRSAGLAGGASSCIYAKKTEPLYSEGEQLSLQFKTAFPDKPLPTLNRPDKTFCHSCQADRKTTDMYRIKAGQYRCGDCVRGIAIEEQRKYSQAKPSVAVA